MVLAKSRREGTMLGRRKARGRKPKDVTAATTSTEPKDAPTARDEAAADTTKLTDLRTRAERLDCCIRKRGDEFHLISRDGSEIGCGSIAALNWELDVLEVELIAGTLKLDDERVGLVLEKLGADRFFAALQHAPALRAAIELRVLGSTPPSPRSQSATRTPRISCAGGSGLANLRSRYTPLGNSMWGVAKPMSISKSFAPCPDARRPISSPPAPGSERESHATSTLSNSSNGRTSAKGASDPIPWRSAPGASSGTTEKRSGAGDLAGEDRLGLAVPEVAHPGWIQCDGDTTWLRSGWRSAAGRCCFATSTTVSLTCACAASGAVQEALIGSSLARA